MSKLCDDKLCEQVAYEVVGRRAGGGGREEEKEEEAAGYRTKNKNPTQRCRS